MLSRMFFNQPSTLQPHHDKHGVRVLVNYRGGKCRTVRVYFLDGPVISGEYPRECFSEGWPEPGDSSDKWGR